jgi:hypothetical protein
MKRIDASQSGIFSISWAPDNRWVAYVRGENEVCIANVESGEIRVIGPGKCPGITANSTVIMERKDQIIAVSQHKETTLLGIDTMHKNSPKRQPQLSPNGECFTFVINNFYDKESESKNAYPYRNFVGICPVDGKKPLRVNNQWYGGTTSWFPDSKLFTHYEFDSTGGARIHIVGIDGVEHAVMFGLYPSVSPDGKRIACKPRSGGNVVVYTSDEGSWSNNAIDIKVFKLPDSKGRISATPPLWLDNRIVMIDEGDKLWRVDTRKENTVEMKKIPVPNLRGQHTMMLSPSRELVAMEVAVEGSFDLLVTPVS